MSPSVDCPVCSGTGQLMEPLTRAAWRNPEAKRERHDYMLELWEAGATLNEIALAVKTRFGSSPWARKPMNHASVIFHLRERCQCLRTAQAAPAGGEGGASATRSPSCIEKRRQR